MLTGFNPQNFTNKPMGTLTVVLGIFFYCSLFCDAWRTHEGDRVYRVEFPSKEILERMLPNLLSLSQEADIWADGSHNSTSFVDIFYPLDDLPSVVSTLESLGISYTVLISNVGELVKRDHRSRSRNVRSVQMINVTSRYHNLTEIHNYFLWLQLRHPELCSQVFIGRSHEGREMKVLKLGIRERRTKPIIWIDAGIHSREFITHSTLLYIIEQLWKGYENKNKAITEMLEQITWMFLPAVNPDGYVYCHETDRLWRKNRRSFQEEGCVGVDLNRNFDYHWNESGTNSNPCHFSYPGPHAFSESESRNVAKFIGSQENVKAFISLHSYSQLVIYPYAYTSDAYPDNHEEQVLLGKKMAETMSSVFPNITYKAGLAQDILYAFSGSSIDYVTGKHNVPLAYLIELRDTGHLKFILPESFIEPVGRETWEGIKVLTEHVMRNYGYTVQAVVSSSAAVNCRFLTLLLVLILPN